MSHILYKINLKHIKDLNRKCKQKLLEENFTTETKRVFRNDTKNKIHKMKK